MSLWQFFKRKRKGGVIPFAGATQLTWGRYFWQGRGLLPAWAGFQERQGAYCGVSSSKPSTGEVRLSVSSPNPRVWAEPSEAQVKAFAHLQKNGDAVRDKMLQAIFDQYPKWQALYKGCMDEEDFQERMPDLRTSSDLKAIIGLSTVHLRAEEKDGQAYAGFEFGCTWDDEHGLGVMTHGDEIIEVGSAEDAIVLRV